jgi:putative addiction module killer protein
MRLNRGMMMYDLKIYKTEAGKEPYIDWLESLDRNVRARIDSRITRIRKTGNLGVHAPVGAGVFELKLDFGPGYRVYFGFERDVLLLLLLGGNKSCQQKDIDKAITYWRNHLSSTGVKK